MFKTDTKTVSVSIVYITKLSLSCCLIKKYAMQNSRNKLKMPYGNNERERENYHTVSDVFAYNLVLTVITIVFLILCFLSFVKKTAMKQFMPFEACVLFSYNSKKSTGRCKFPNALQKSDPFFRQMDIDTFCYFNSDEVANDDCEEPWPVASWQRHKFK